MNQLAQRWHLQAELKTWHHHAESVGYGEEQTMLHVATSKEPHATAAVDGAAARERLMARWGKRR